jgi:hypothetical protein
MSRLGRLGVSRPESDARRRSVAAGQRLAVGGRVVSPHALGGPIPAHRGHVRATVEDAQGLQMLITCELAVAAARQGSSTGRKVRRLGIGRAYRIEHVEPVWGQQST